MSSIYTRDVPLRAITVEHDGRIGWRYGDMDMRKNLLSNIGQETWMESSSLELIPKESKLTNDSKTNQKEGQILDLVSSRSSGAS